MNFETITFTVEAGIARLTLNRPDKLNSFNTEMHAELRTALDSIQNDISVRVLVLSGAGRAFCAGQDLADRAMQMVDGKMPDIGNTVERITGVAKLPMTLGGMSATGFRAWLDRSGYGSDAYHGNIEKTILDKRGKQKVIKIKSMNRQLSDTIATSCFHGGTRLCTRTTNTSS